MLLNSRAWEKSHNWEPRLVLWSSGWICHLYNWAQKRRHIKYDSWGSWHCWSGWWWPADNQSKVIKKFFLSLIKIFFLPATSMTVCNVIYLLILLQVKEHKTKETFGHALVPLTKDEYIWFHRFVYHRHRYLGGSSQLIFANTNGGPYSKMLTSFQDAWRKFGIPGKPTFSMIRSSISTFVSSFHFMVIQCFFLPILLEGWYETVTLPLKKGFYSQCFNVERTFLFLYIVFCCISFCGSVLSSVNLLENVKC